MAKYNYSRYRVKEVWSTPPFRNQQNFRVMFTGLSRVIEWDSDARRFNFFGSYADADRVNYQDYGYAQSLNKVFRYRSTESGNSMAYNNIYCYVDEADITETSLIRRENSGTLLATLVAENGTYPANDYHTDGYWYVRGTLANTAPTTPGAFTQPTGTLEIGDAKVFSVGASSDAEGNLSKYIWEAAINGGSFAKVGETSTPSFTYTIPTATSLKMRVKAADSGGLESGYRESAQFTVTKPMYYWSKYHKGAENYVDFEYKEETSVRNGYSSFRVEGIYFYTAGTYLYSSDISIGMYVYSSGSGSTFVDRFQKISEAKSAHSIGRVKTRDIRGALIQSDINAIEGTYPVNGVHSDGYWYVRGSRVSQSIAPPSAFTAPAINAVLEPKQALTLAFGASTAPSISTYEVQSRYNNGAWQNVGTHTNALTCVHLP